jgi:DNA mismatch repair ATPase MutS
MIADKEIEIMQELSKKILQYSNQLTDTVSFLSELDWYLPKLNYLVVDDD